MSRRARRAWKYRAEKSVGDQQHSSFYAQGKYKMDTDEYEVSLAREINVCMSVIKQTQIQLARRQQRFGMDWHQAVKAVAEGSPVIDRQELADWRDDVEALPQWQQRLEQYREALASLRISENGGGLPQHRPS